MEGRILQRRPAPSSGRRRPSSGRPPGAHARPKRPLKSSDFDRRAAFDIDGQLAALERRAKDSKANLELKQLDAQIPLSPLPRLAAKPKQRRDAATAAATAATNAATAAAHRAAELEAEKARRAAAAATAAAEAEAAEHAAAAAKREAEAAAEAAERQRQQIFLVGERRRRPKPTRTIEEEDAAAAAAWGDVDGHGVATQQLREHVAASDWVSAARIAVAMALQTSLHDGAPTSTSALPPLPPRTQTPPEAVMTKPVESRMQPSPSEESTDVGWRHEFGVGWVPPPHEEHTHPRPPPPVPPPSALAVQDVSAGEETHAPGGMACSSRSAPHASPIRHSQRPHEMTPRRLRALMLTGGPPPDLASDSFETLVAKECARRTANEAILEAEDESGHLSFVGVASTGVGRAVRNGYAKPYRAAQTSSPAPVDTIDEVARIDLRAVEAADAKLFARRERQAAAAAKREREGPAVGERIMGLVQELGEPRQVRDFDAEIGGLLHQVRDHSRVR